DGNRLASAGHEHLSRLRCSISPCRFLGTHEQALGHQARRVALAAAVQRRYRAVQDGAILLKGHAQHVDVHDRFDPGLVASAVPLTPENLARTIRDVNPEPVPPLLGFWYVAHGHHPHGGEGATGPSRGTDQRYRTVGIACAAIK